jgi:hypothetical protein
MDDFPDFCFFQFPGFDAPVRVAFEGNRADHLKTLPGFMAVSLVI